ncbi:MAG: hypothetical protein C0467_15315 [Planctomycetaceae bacterium]|nr:hypothetical protein [Planctomycetaceae bacterium]
MATTVVLDELHVTFRNPSELPAARTEELGLTLRSTEFMSRLRRAVRSVVRGYPELVVVTVTVTR